MTGIDFRIQRQAKRVELRRMAKLCGWRDGTLRDIEDGAITPSPEDIRKFKRKLADIPAQAAAV